MLDQIKIKKRLFFCIFVLVLLLSISSTAFAKSKYEYQISICAIFRDDARFLKEWIEFHRINGVKHFWLFNNLSQDDYLSILNPYIKKGIVELIQWPYESEDWDHWHEIQNSAYEKGISLAKKKTKWLALIDTDEFIVPVQEKSLIDVLDTYENYGGVCANWQRFGTSGVKRIPDDALMLETLTKRAPKDWKLNRRIKTIVRPERVKKVLSAHHVAYRGRYYQIDENKKKIQGQKSPEITVNKLQINHYWTRDEDFFFNVKIARRWKPGCELDLKRYLDLIEACNQIEDDMYLRYIKPLKKRVFGKNFLLETKQN